MKLDQETIHAIGEVLMHANHGDHVQATGIHMEHAEPGYTRMRMDYHNDIVGNPQTGWVSGGALMALLDSCCGFTASTAGEELEMNTTIDFRIDYLRVAEAEKPIFAEARVYRRTRHITFMKATAYQEKDAPIATAVGTFMHMDGVDGGFAALQAILASGKSLPKRIQLNDSVKRISATDMESMLQRTKGDSDASELIESIPYTQFLNMSRIMDTSDGSWIFHLPPSKSIIGHAALPAIHGGALAGFMEYSALIHLILKMDIRRVPKIIDFSVDFIRAGYLKDTFVRCKIIRFGRKLVSLNVDAWQEDNTKPIAKARLQILID